MSELTLNKLKLLCGTTVLLTAIVLIACFHLDGVVATVATLTAGYLFGTLR